MHESHHESRSEPKGGYEIRDVHLSVVIVGVVALGFVCVFAFVLAAAIIPVMRSVAPDPTVVEGGAPIDYGRLLPPEPRLQPDPPATLAEFKAAEEEFLSTYGWINRQEGVVRLPVSRAIDLVLERGSPTWPPVDDASTSSPVGAGGSAPAQPNAAMEQTNEAVQ